MHYNTKYGSYNEAIEYRDGLAIFAILLEEDLENNPLFDPINKLLNQIKFKDWSMPIPDGFDAAHFIPGIRSQSDYILYKFRFHFSFQKDTTFGPMKVHLQLLHAMNA